MKGKPFFDTNLLVYSVDTGPRADTATALMLQGGVVSVQVLNEFVSVVRRKLKMSWPDTLEALSAFNVLLPDPVAITLDLHHTALGIAERFGYHIYDSLVIAAALQTRCDTLYSEDMQTGQKIQGLTIRNPF